MKKPLFFLFLISAIAFPPRFSLATRPSDFGLKEGDLISAIFSSDPDVYIINDQGYKRLFLNPEIFKFYKHLGGFANVKLVDPETRDSFPTSGLFRNCEARDHKVYGIEVSGEDKGALRWIDEPGDQVVKDDPDFFKKVFCINTKEFNWYPKKQELKSVKEVPVYTREEFVKAIPAIPAPAVPTLPSQTASSSRPLVPTVITRLASGSLTPTPIPSTIPAIPAIPANPSQPGGVPASTLTPSTPATTTPTSSPTVSVSNWTNIQVTNFTGNSNIYYGEYPAVTWNGSGYGVVWTGSDGTPSAQSNIENLFFQKLDAEGKPVGLATRLTSHGYCSCLTATLPSIAWSGTTYGVVWIDDNADGSGQNLRLVTLNADGGKFYDIPLSSSGDNTSANTRPAIKWLNDKSRFAITWQGSSQFYAETTNSGSLTTYKKIATSAEWDLVNKNDLTGSLSIKNDDVYFNEPSLAQELVGVTLGSDRTPYLSWSGTRFAAVWVNIVNNQSQIFFGKRKQDGPVQQPTPTPLPMPIITVTSPNGGEQWLNGSTYPITWTSTNNVTNVRIELYRGSTRESYLYDGSNTAGSWNWTVPTDTAYAADAGYSIRVTATYPVSPEVYDESNGTFNLKVPTASAADLTGLIGHWKFDGDGANTVAGGPLAVTVGAATFQSSGGKLGGYAYVPSGSDYLKIPYNSIFDLPNSFTVEFWFRQRADQSFSQNLVYKGSGLNNYNFYIFRRLWNQYNFGEIITGYTSNTTGYWTQTSNGNQLAHNVWHHVVYTKGPDMVAYYLDGSLIHGVKIATQSEYAGPAKTPANDIIIGDTAVDTDFDNLLIYSRGLSSLEVLQHYAYPSLVADRSSFWQRLANIGLIFSKLTQEVKFILTNSK